MQQLLLLKMELSGPDLKEMDHTGSLERLVWSLLRDGSTPLLLRSPSPSDLRENNHSLLT